MVNYSNNTVPESKFEIVKRIQSAGLKIKEELRTGENIYLIIKQNPSYLSLTIILYPNGLGGTRINSVFKVNWLRLLLNAGVFVGASFILILLTYLLLKESVLEGFALLTFNVFLMIGLYSKLMHFSNKELATLLNSSK